MPSATADVTDAPRALTLPRLSFAKISPGHYLAAHLQASPPIRPDGRTTSQFRTPACTTGSLNHCAGSAVVRVGDTAVVCGIRPEVLRLDSVPHVPQSSEASNQEDPITTLGLLVPNVELATGCSPAHLPGGAPTIEAQTLVQKLRRTLLRVKLIDSDDLKITSTRPLEDDQVPERQETVAYWTLYAAIHVLSLSGSHSLFDVAWAALVAALHDVKIPRAWWDFDAETILCSDKLSESHKLNMMARPFACTWGIFPRPDPVSKEMQQDENLLQRERTKLSFASLLADPDGFEDPLCEEGVTLLVDFGAGERFLKGIDKSGGLAIGKNELSKLCLVSRQRWAQWDEVIPI